MQAIIIFFFVLNEMKNGGLHLDPTRFFHQPQQSFISGVDETLWGSLAPFGVISGVELVQALITGRRRAQIQLNRIKYQATSEKSQTWWVQHQ